MPQENEPGRQTGDISEHDAGEALPGGAGDGTGLPDDKRGETHASASARLDVAEMTQAKAAPGTAQPPVPGEEDLSNRGVDRSVVIGEGIRATSTWALRLIIIAVAAAGLLWVLSKLWVGVFPVVLALIVCTVLWPPVKWLRERKVPPALASIGVILLALGIFTGIMVAIAPSVVSQGQGLASTAGTGVGRLIEWLSGPPLNVDRNQLDDLVAQGTDWLRRNGGRIASGVFTGVGTLGNGLVAVALVAVLSFFFLKDGPNFLPWLRRFVGRSAGRHLTEVLVRSWATLGGFIRAQAIVSAVDAVLIGVGLLILGVPLAVPLAVLVFFGGFIPIVGAVAVGALAVLIGLVDGGPTTALIVLAIIIGVQQLESNLLQPFLQGKSMQLHAGIILLSVTAGGTLFGIAGAFLAVPAAAILAVIIRYLSEQTDLRTGDLTAAETHVATKEGETAARWAQWGAHKYRQRRRTPSNEAARAESGDSEDQGDREDSGNRGQAGSEEGRRGLFRRRH